MMKESYLIYLHIYVSHACMLCKFLILSTIVTIQASLATGTNGVYDIWGQTPIGTAGHQDRRVVSMSKDRPILAQANALPAPSGWLALIFNEKYRPATPLAYFILW